jgi:hypothetical protein
MWSDGTVVVLNQQVIINVFYGNGNETYELGTRFFVHKRIISAIKRLPKKESTPQSYFVRKLNWK